MTPAPPPSAASMPLCNRTAASPSAWCRSAPACRWRAKRPDADAALFRRNILEADLDVEGARRDRVGHDHLGTVRLVKDLMILARYLRRNGEIDVITLVGQDAFGAAGNHVGDLPHLVGDGGIDFRAFLAQHLTADFEDRGFGKSDRLRTARLRAGHDA